MSDQEIRRGRDRGGFRLGQGQLRRYHSPGVRFSGGGWGPGRVPLNGWGRGDSFDGMPRRRKAQVQDDRRRDRRIGFQQQGGQRVQRFANGWATVRQQDVRSATAVACDLQQGDSPNLRLSIAEKEGRGDGNHAQNVIHGGTVAVENETRKFVTFYFTNFPECASQWFLRKGFEVCGILDDVFVAPRCNARGQAYGFVRFLQVKDVDKMVQALNNVWFGDFQIWAKVAKFQRNKSEAVKKSGDVVSKGCGKAQVGEGGKGSGKLVEGDLEIVDNVVKVGDVSVKLNGKNGTVERKTVPTVVGRAKTSGDP